MESGNGKRWDVGTMEPGLGQSDGRHERGILVNARP